MKKVEKKMSFWVSPRHLLALSYFAEKPGSWNRHLHGVHCEITPHRMRLVATDGHSLGIIELPHHEDINGYSDAFELVQGPVSWAAPQAPPATVTLPIWDALPFLKTANSGQQNKQGAVLIEVDGRNLTFTHALSGLSIRLYEEEHQFPNYRLVLHLGHRASIEGGSFNPGYLARFATVANVLGLKSVTTSFRFTGDDNNPLAVKLDDAPYFYSVVMPMRGNEASLEEPAWLSDGPLAEPIRRIIHPPESEPIIMASQPDPEQPEVEEVFEEPEELEGESDEDLDEIEAEEPETEEVETCDLASEQAVGAA